MRHFILLAAVAALASLSSCGTVAPPASVEAAGPAAGIVRAVIPAPSLEGDIAGDETPLEALVYLPPSYAAEPGRRYPLLVLLHGYWVSPEIWEGDEKSITSLLADALASGEAREMIIVMPSGENRLGGGFYVNGAASGDWEDYVAEDVVAFMDATYRTLAARESRGIAGHSMGGYGALSVAASRPDVFSAAYAMSPCCGDLVRDFATTAPGWAAADTLGSLEVFDASDNFHGRVLAAIGAAWAPDAGAPLMSGRPVAGGVVDDAVLETWLARTLTRRVADNAASLREYTAIGLDVGDREDFPHILQSVPELAAQMAALGIVVEYEMYPGDHINGIGTQLREEVFPFFSQHLVAE